MGLRPYPTEIPAETWGIVYEAVTGHVADVAHAAHCAEDCLAFALSKALPDKVITAHPLALGATGSDKRLEAVNAVKHLAQPGLHMAPVGIFPWMAIFQMILQFLATLGK